MSFSEKILHSAEEGVVLLKNENNALPLTDKDSISIFGRIQGETYRGGTGSGGSVHMPYITHFADSMNEIAEKTGMKINAELCNLYKEFLKNNPFDNGGGEWASEPWHQKEMDVTQELASKAASSSNKAVVIIGRTAGEDRDYQAVKGAWYLTDEEVKNLENICAAFETVIVVFNTSGIMDTAWISDAKFQGKIKAVVYGWQGGQESGRAIANVITGQVTPSGKLTDTIACSIEDYPSTETFAQKQSLYKEDIYVGYRYFNTFAKDKILYPFGFGLSYTQFKLENAKANCDGKTVTVEVTVKNAGTVYSGKEVVQVYFSAPQGKLGKASRELIAYAKTSELAPGKSEKLTLKFDINDMACYDDSGATGNEFCKVLEAGDYRIFAGTDSLSASQIFIGDSKAITIKETVVVKKLTQCLAPSVDYERLVPGEKKSDGNFTCTYQKVPVSKVDLAQRIKDNLPKEIPMTGNKGITFEDVKKDASKLDAFVGQLDVTQLATVVRGEGMCSQKVTAGIAAAFGGISESLHNTYKIPCAGCADGPSGLRLDTGAECSLMPIGTQLACSWNLDLVRELYEEEGKELASHQVDSLLGPGMNIHRHPLNGRNFEYFSEDPFVTGTMAMAQVKGLYEGGAGGTIKHFALNNQETMRRTSDSVASERALREIYLKPFEMTVNEGIVKSIMTSYNSINGHWAASNYDLVNSILRKEWNYKGLVMTDWWAGMNHCVEGGESSIKNLSYMVRARNDIYMVVDNNGAEINVYKDNLEDSLKDGSVTIGELQLCVKDILTFILEAPVSKRPLAPLTNTAVFENNPSATGEPLKLDQYFSPEADKEYLISTENESEVTIIGVIFKARDDVSQSTTNIFIDGKHAASFECRTTYAKDRFIIATKVRLLPGTHTVKMEHTKPGITMKTLKLETVPYNPVLAGHIQ